MRSTLLAVALSTLSVPVVVDAADPVDFRRDVRPILAAHCFHCHGPDEENRQAELRLDVRESAVEIEAIVPGDVDASELVARITSTDHDVMMPPPETKKPLSARQIAVLKAWVADGAPYEKHWSFVTPTKPEPPSADGWGTHPIDAFSLARMKAKGLEPSPEARRELLIRRVTFDLTGLPPTLAEIDAFVADESPDAYEKVVDRLLASRRYGERMALQWMDAARYGDTSVYHADGPRDMWYWRDWVIRSYNENKPFDDFTVEQLAGDLIPNATVDQIAATAFARNHGTTDEGGAIDEEYRVEYMVDRVKTTGTIWLGMTLECGQCHDHKYDPLSQKDYYRLFAFFNRSSERGMQTRRGNADPKIDVPNVVGEEQAKAVRKEIEDLKVRRTEHAAKVEAEFVKWVAAKSAETKGEPLVPTDVLAHFALDEGEGKSVIDAIDPKRATTINGRAAWADGKHGKAFDFDGRTRIDVGDIANFERTDQFSYGAWVYFDGNGTPIARMKDGMAYRGWDLYLSGNKVAMHLINTWPANAIKVTTKEAFKAKEWHHLFVTYDGSSKAAGVRLYVDGKAREWNIEQNGLTGTTKSDVPLYLGSRNPGSTFKGKVDDVRIYGRTLSEAEVAALAGSDPLASILAAKPEDRTKEQIDTLRRHYLTSIDAEYPKLTKEITDREARIKELTKPLTSVMVLKDQPRDTYVLMRGHYGSPDKSEVMQPDTPAFLPAMKADLPKNRLGLARWIVDPENPLTARVTVNRYWYLLFGRGLVESLEDFGSQGAFPTHPELLDWLAVDFVENGWNVKRTIKQIVMSNTYRQSSRISPRLREVDPANLLLARGPRFRLQGEFVRDNALAVSGLLVDTVGGPGVKPYQPPGLWNEVALTGNVRFVQDHGEKLYRRSMYIYWKRSAPMPAMMIFDAPTREKCVVRRPRTNTPLQALVTLNDPQFVEASRMLAERLMKEGGDTPESRLEYAYRLATGRRPTSLAREVLLGALAEEREVFRKEPDRATKLLAIGEHARDESLDAVEHAAWTMVASMILNLDAVLTRG